MILRALILILFTAPAVNLFAGGLTLPFSFDSTATLPKGVRNVRLMGMTTEAKTYFDDSGEAEVLGARMTRKISYGEMIGALKDAKQRADYTGALESHGGSLGDAAGESTGIATVRVTVGLPVLAYGITDNWTTAVAIPIVASQLAVNTGFKASSSLNGLIAKMYAEGSREEMAKVAQMTQNVIQYQAALNSYKPLQDQNKTQIGDINLVNKYRFYKGENWIMAAVGTVVLPTGRRPDVDRIVDVGSGDGAWSVGSGLVTDYVINGHWTTTGSVSYLAQLPDRLKKRIPNDLENTITSDLDPTTYRDRGDIMKTSAGVRYKPFDTLSFSTAYAFQYREPDKFTGAAFEPTRYSILETDTEAMLQTAQFGFGYSTVGKYQRQETSIPWEANVGYTVTLAGKNAPRDDIAALEMVLFF